MNCNLCHLPYDHNSHVPRVLSCCGKSLCHKCCIKLDEEQTKTCPYCPKPQENPKFQDLPINIDLKSTIPEWKSSICQKHRRMNDMICESCEVELCIQCLNVHNDHNYHSITDVYDEVKNIKNEYRDWVAKAKNKSEQYEKLVLNYQNLLIKNTNEDFENLILKIRSYQQKAIEEIEARFKSREFQSYFLQGGADIKKTIQECEKFLSTSEEQVDIFQKLKFSKQNSLKPIMNWSMKDDANELNNSLFKINFKFDSEYNTPFMLKELDGTTTPPKDENKERYPLRNKTSPDQEKDINEIFYKDHHFRYSNSKKIGKTLKEKKLKLQENEDYGDLADQVEKKIFSFCNNLQAPYYDLITSVVNALKKNELDIPGLKNLLNTGLLEFNKTLISKSQVQIEEEGH